MNKRKNLSSTIFGPSLTCHDCRGDFPLDMTAISEQTSRVSVCLCGDCEQSRQLDADASSSTMNYRFQKPPILNASPYQGKVSSNEKLEMCLNYDRWNKRCRPHSSIFKVDGEVFGKDFELVYTLGDPSKTPILTNTSYWKSVNKKKT